MHFCHEELFVVLGALPGLKYLVTCLRVKLHKNKCGCETKLQEVTNESN
mgnify:CR=1 FL=1